MHGFPKGLDLSFFVGKRLDQVSFAEYTIFVRFEGGVSVELVLNQARFRRFHGQVANAA